MGSKGATMTQKPRPSAAVSAEAERQELVAYDVLALLIGVLGVDDVLSTLRLWYVVSSLDDKGRRRRALQRGK
jgi:hypothetical protein